MPVTRLIRLGLLLAVLASGRAAAWQNPANPLDVNGDGQVTGADSLLILEELNSNGTHRLSAGSPPPYFDVDGDGLVSTADVTAVVEYLNAPGVDAAAQTPGGSPGLSGPGGAPGTGSMPGTELPGAVAPFSFQVPVIVERLHTDVQAIGVECYVSDTPVALAADARFTGITVLAAISSIVGYGISTPAAVPAGSYSGILTVTFEPLAGRDAATASHYGCGLVLYGGGGRITDLEQPYTPVTDPQHPHHDAWQPEAGSAFVVAVSGTL